MPTSRYIAIDPGHTIGIAEFSDKGTFLKRFKLKNGDLFNTWLQSYIEETAGKVIIIEEFKIYPSMDNTLLWQSLETIEVIGAIKYAIWKSGAHSYVMQMAVRKDMPLKWLGMHYKKSSHVPDEKAAHAHGVYYLEKNNVITVDKAISDNERYQG